MSIKFLYRKLFENKLLRSQGDSFQQIVYQLLRQKYDDFEMIETQGAIGDRKNDGYRKGKGIFYQVYGPKDISANITSLSTAIKKMPRDFNVLKSHIAKGYWEEIKTYIFVFKTFISFIERVLPTPFTVLFFFELSVPLLPSIIFSLPFLNVKS